MHIFNMLPIASCKEGEKVKFVVSGLNATGKTPMYERPLTFVLGGWGFIIGREQFCIGVLGFGILSLVFCPMINVIHIYRVLTKQQQAEQAPTVKCIFGLNSA